MIKGIQSWQIIQQNNGIGSVTFTIDRSSLRTDFGGKKIVRYEYRFVDEATDAPVTAWYKALERDTDIICTIDRIPVGGLYYLAQKLVVETGFEAQEFPSGIRHVGVGDVFLIVGQSNAAGWGRGIMTDSPEYGINVLRKDNSWDMATNPLSEYHSPMLSFAKLLHKKLGYPIGLIPRAVGGAPIAPWLPGGSHMKRVEREREELYPAVKAIICYHGCSECGEQYLQYRDNFITFASHIREVFGDSELPIFTFQLNRMQAGGMPEILYKSWPAIREIQRTMPSYLDKLYVIPTIDAMKMSDNIHNSKSSNLMLGERLGYNVLGELYGRAADFRAPDLRCATVSSRTLTLYFDNVCSFIGTFWLSADRLPISVADDGGRVPLESYSVDGACLVLTLARETVGEVLVSGMTDMNLSEFLIDDETQLPVLSFHEVRVQKN